MLTAGFWQVNYFVKDYWQDDYWQDYAFVAGPDRKYWRRRGRRFSTSGRRG